MVPRRVIIIYHYCSLWKACVSVVPDVYLPQCQCYGNKLTSNATFPPQLIFHHHITLCLALSLQWLFYTLCLANTVWFLACYHKYTGICVYPCLVSGGVTVTPISLSTTLRVSPPTFVTAAAELRRLAAPGAHQLSTNQTAKAFTSPSGKF